jgi:hypothetical protein
MRLQSDVPMSFAHERYLRTSSCPKCGELIMAPDCSEYLKKEGEHPSYMVM